MGQSALTSVTRALAAAATPRGFFVACVCLTATLPEALAYGARLAKLRFVPFALIYTATGLIPTLGMVWLGHIAVSASH